MTTKFEKPFDYIRVQRKYPIIGWFGIGVVARVFGDTNEDVIKVVELKYPKGKFKQRFILHWRTEQHYT